MKEKMPNKAKILIGIGVIVCVVLGVWLSKKDGGNSFSGGGTTSNKIVLTGSRNSSDVITKSFVETTTDPIIKSVSLGTSVDQVQVNLCVTASSTVAQVNFDYEYSDDNTNWFSAIPTWRPVSPTSTINFLAATTTYNMVPGTIEQRCVSVPIIDTNGKFHRFKFRRGLADPSDRNYSIYAEGIFSEVK